MNSKVPQVNHREQLAGFHHTISEQLNARLAESPKFFGLLIVVSTGYGYVLLNQKGAFLLAVTSALAYVAVLWAIWYLAALGYAFRFLQNGQHCMEHALGWNKYVPSSKAPPGRIRWRFGDVFWLLPGIYHAHAFGLMCFLAIIVGGICWQYHLYLGTVWTILTGAALATAGIGFTILVNVHYVRRFRERCNDPSKSKLVIDEMDHK